MANRLYISDTADARRNLALDEWFLDHIAPDDLILYFYVNAPSVIIGRNQNPLKECALREMERDNVTLVRRISGGGAVYHDRGNLNFSFIAGYRYDKEKQLRLIATSLGRLGISCSFSGRNDLLCGKKKFSGSAYCSRGNRHQHHGTLLVCSDLDAVSRYLTPDLRKLRAKGVDSVRSRVCNLCEALPGLTVEKLTEIIIDTARTLYGGFSACEFTGREYEEIDACEEKHNSPDWLYGQTPPFDYEIDCRLSYGSVDCLLSSEDGRVRSVKVYTDANDDALPQKIEAAIVGCSCEKNALCAALGSAGDRCLSELAEYIRDSL